MPRVGLELMTSMFERTKTVHVSDNAATITTHPTPIQRPTLETPFTGGTVGGLLAEGRLYGFHFRDRTRSLNKSVMSEI
jgi:hypothetical protein